MKAFGAEVPSERRGRQEQWSMSEEGRAWG